MWQLVPFGADHMTKLTRVLLALVVVAVVGLASTAAFVPVKDLATETYKTLLQLVVIGAAGHVVSLLVTKANNDRQDLLRLNELRKLLLDRLNDAFIQVKKIRRIARATADKRRTDAEVEYFIDRTQFHEYLQAINETQLDLELVSKEIVSSRALFRNPDFLVENVDSMEEYLNRIVDEYEHTLTSESLEVPATFHIRRFPELHDLLGAYKTSKFRGEFVHRYYASLDAIRNDLTHVIEPS